MGTDSIVVTVEGDISAETIAEILKRHLPERKIICSVKNINDNKNSNEDKLLDANNNSIVVGLLSERNIKLQDELERKTVLLQEAETQKTTFQRQHESLYKRYNTLRQQFDTQKESLLKVLWIHCGRYHPDLGEIPLIEDEPFVETDEKVGKYILGEQLGQGQFATVRSGHIDDTFLMKGAKSKQVNQELAIKIMKKERFTTFPALRRISTEIEVLRSFKSDFIISIKDVIQTKKHLYIVTDKGGRDLFESFDDKPDGVPELWAKDIITCVLKAVLYCHERGICHRGTVQYV